mgnify:FL=1
MKHLNNPTSFSLDMTGVNANHHRRRRATNMTNLEFRGQ